ncbi:MAG: CAP domain-containing protein [Chitinophagaceae bacterium]
MKKVVLLLLVLIPVLSQAQNPCPSYPKAEKAFQANKLKSADKLIDKCLADNKSNPSAYLLKAKIQFAIYKDKSISADYPGAMKDALKYAEKAVEAVFEGTPRNTFINSNSDFFELLVKQNTKEALDAYNNKRYAKALPLFKKNLSFKVDTQSMVYAADCYWQMEQKDESLPLFKKSAEMIYAAVLDSNSKIYGFHKEPFRRLCEYYAKKGEMDSAYLYVKNGREILPDDPKLSEYTYKLMRFQLDKIPPSYDYLAMVKSGLKDFPFDSFLNHRENSIYIYLLNGMAEAGDQRQFDSLLNVYASSKTAKKSLKQLTLVKRYDIFAALEKAEFLNAIIQYFTDFGLPAASYSAWISQYNYAHPGVSEAQKNKDLMALMSTENNIRLGKNLYQYFMQRNFKSVVAADFIKSLSSYTDSKNGIQISYVDIPALISLNEMTAGFKPKVPAYGLKIKTDRMRLIDEAADSGDFRLARETHKIAAAKYPDQQVNLNKLWRKIIENDFKRNYYGSRINAAGKKEAGIPEYSWSGYADSCKWGKMSEDIVSRAEQRINYFRRMAGLTEMIALTTEDNEMCQMAVLMCEANKSMSHEPNDGWRCFIPAGADALKNAILSKDGNPAIAITAAMGQNHATAGNRRWLLYPNAAYMGIGTSKSYTAIKAIDNSAGIDTNKYKQQFVAWPPKDACPKMLVFKKWSFSIDQALEGAVVTMKDGSGAAVELKQEIPVNGYGMNTLVWEPQINTMSLPDNSSFTVSIVLKSKKTYTYVVNVIDVKL